MPSFNLYGCTDRENVYNFINTYTSLEDTQVGADFSLGSCLDEEVALSWKKNGETWTAEFNAPDGKEHYLIERSITIVDQFEALSTEDLQKNTIPSLHQRILECEVPDQLALFKIALSLADTILERRLRMN